MSRYTLVIHGGAGTILKKELTPELERLYTDGLKEALAAGFSILEKGGTSLDAVQAAVVSLEDNILFNAGRGSVFTKKGVQEMDAALMEGKLLKAGAVAGVRNIRNPVLLAGEVMQNSQHVFLSGTGAEEFAAQRGITTENDDYFFSSFRYNQWRAVADSDDYLLDHAQQPQEQKLHDKKFGTVGAVACDRHGNIAAATSTGGMTNKQFGRIGDSPVIGAGTYANNETCAISCTGHGEIFLRAVTAYDVSCLMEYKGLSLQEACHKVVHEKLVALQGEGGLIGVDKNGSAAMMFNSAGMYRGMQSSDGTKEIGIYNDKVSFK